MERAAAADSLNEATVAIERARALVDVLSETVCPLGDAEEGKALLERLRPHSLYETLATLDDLLVKAAAHIDAGFPKLAPAVAIAAADSHAH